LYTAAGAVEDWQERNVYWEGQGGEGKVAIVCSNICSLGGAESITGSC